MKTIDEQNENAPARTMAPLGAIIWPALLLISAAFAVFGLAPTTHGPAFVMDWDQGSTGVLFLAAAILVTVGQQFLLQHFEAGRIKRRLIDQLEFDHAEGERLIDALSTRVARSDEKNGR